MPNPAPRTTAWWRVNNFLNQCFLSIRKRCFLWVIGINRQAGLFQRRSLLFAGAGAKKMTEESEMG
jgi:hypothetical protein